MSQLLLSALGPVCPTCDTLNAPMARQCVSCGGALFERGKSAAATPKIAAQKPAPVASVAPAVAPVAKPAARPAPATGVPAQAPLPAVPPGMKPSIRPLTGAAPSEELVRKPGASGTHAAPSRFTVAVVAGAGAGQRFRLAGATVHVGRSRGAILFVDDPHVSAQHATFLIKDGRLFIRDEGSTSGTFLAVQSETLPPGSFFCAGHRLFRYVGPVEPPPLALGRPITYGAPVPTSGALYLVEEILAGGRPGRAIVSQGPLLTVGQSQCDLSYPQEPGLAARHCEITPTLNGCMVRDLSGGLGTFVRITGERPLASGDRVRIGDQVLQIEAAA